MKSKMSEYNLTARQKQLLKIIVENIKEGKDIEPLIPSITLQDNQIIGIDHQFGRTLDLDLEALCEADLISGIYNSVGSKVYTVKQSGYDAVANNFGTSESGQVMDSSIKGNTPKIFLSHIHEEALLALVLKKWIEDTFPDRIKVFVSSDKKDIRAGEKWFDRIDGALGESQTFIVLCSQNSIKRPWINFETGCAWIKKVPVIAICHSGQSIHTLPRPLSDFQGLAVDDQAFIDDLLTSLAHHLELGRIPPIDKTSMSSEISNAIDSLSKIAQSSIPENAQKTVPALLSELKDGESSKIRAKAAGALGKTGRPEVLPDLMDATKDRSPGVSEAAKEAIEEILRNSSVSLDQPIDLTSLLVSHRWELIFRPPNQSKPISFLSDGSVGEGQNQNEHTWRIQNNKLELIQEDGHVHSRFNFVKETQRFIHTNDPDTRSIRDQIIQMV